jgi:hypothetical protein
LFHDAASTGIQHLVVQGLKIQDLNASLVPEFPIRGQRRHQNREKKKKISPDLFPFTT